MEPEVQQHVIPEPPRMPPIPPAPPEKKSKYNPVLVMISIIIGATLLIGGTVFVLITREQNEAAEKQAEKEKAEESSVVPTQIQQVQWSFDGNVWKANSTPPPCPNQFLLTTPVPLNRVQSVLYPGQTRGGNYKSHGGFRLKDANEVAVVMPLDAMLVSGSRYTENGETQYLLHFVHSCGIAFRFDHLHSLTLELQNAVDTLPPAQPDDSSTTPFEKQIFFEEGQNIATAVGFKNPQNVFVDFGLYDLRKPNEASKDPAYAQLHQSEKEQAFYAVCWLDYLLANDSYTLENLPSGDAAAGKISDYCK